MLNDAEMYLDNHLEIIEGCCDTEDEDVVKEVAECKEKKKKKKKRKTARPTTNAPELAKGVES